MSASRWVAVAWPTTSTRPARTSSPMTSATVFPPTAAGCDLIFCDPPYHTMLAQQYARDGIAAAPLSEWVAFLHHLARHAFDTLRPGGYLALLLAAQTEKDLPAGFGYLDHAFFGYIAALRAGFLPERRISCPMDGAYLPQHVRRARSEGRLLGQVRDLLVVRKPAQVRESQVPRLSYSCKASPDCQISRTIVEPRVMSGLSRFRLSGSPQASS